MKKLVSKKFGLLLVVAFVSLFIIAACESSQSSENEDTDLEKTDKEDNSEEPTDISISMRTLGFVHVQNHPDINEDKYVNKLEDLTNVDLDINLIPHDEFTTKMDLMFASGDIPDVVQTSGGYGEANGETLKDAIEAGVFLKLDDLIKEHAPNLMEKVPEAAWEQQTFRDGHIYSIPEFLGNPSRRATIIRADLLEEAGIPIPTKPEEAWTVEETLDVLRTFKDMGVDQPYTGRAEFKYSDTFFGAYDAQAFTSMWQDVNGTIQPKFFNEENMQNALETYKTMYDEGLIHPEFLTHQFNDYKNAGISGKAGMWSMNANELLQWEAQLQESIPDADLEIIPSPRGPDGNGGYYLYGNVTRGYLINKDAEDKAVEIIKFLDWMLTDEAETFFSFGIEGEDYTMDGNEINYQAPESNDEIDLERYRTGWLWMVKDTTYYEKLLGQSEEGQKLMETYDTILAEEGRDGIRFEPPLEALDNTPQLKAKSDRPADFIMEHIAKMVTGEQPIDNWSKVVEEWKSRGGDEALKEAQKRFDDGEYLDTRR